MENVFSHLLVSVYEAKISRREKEKQTNNKEESNVCQVVRLHPSPPEFCTSGTAKRPTTPVKGQSS